MSGLLVRGLRVKATSSIGAALREVGQLGLRRAAYSLAYEGLNRSGLRRVLQPVRDCLATAEPDYLGRQRVDLNWFRRHRAPFFVAGGRGRGVR